MHLSSSFSRWLGGLLTLLLLSSLSAPWAQQPPGLMRTPAPSAAEQSKALERIQLWYRDLKFKENDPASHKQVTTFLLERIPMTTFEKPVHYMLHREVARLWATSGEVLPAFQMIDELGRLYVIEPLPLKKEALALAISHTKDPEHAKGLVELTLAWLTEVLNADEHELAGELGQLAEDAARKAKSLPLVLAVQKERRGLATAQQQFAQLKPSLQQLKQQPDDADANLAVGKYLCLAKGNWERGLFLLAQGSDRSLRLQAQRDLIRPTHVPEQLDVGDGWWELALKETEQRKVHLQQRAVFWYQYAVANTTGEVRARLEQRIAAVPLPRNEGLLGDYAGPPGLMRVLTGHNNPVLAVAFTADGKKLVSGAQNNIALLWNATTGQPLLTFTNHFAQVTAVAAHPKDAHLLSAGWDGTVRVWDMKKAQQLRQYPAAGRIGNINSLAQSADGRLVVLGSADGSVSVVDITTGANQRQMFGHGGQVFGVALSADGQKLLSSGNDNSLILWSLQNGQLLRRIFMPNNNNPRQVALTPDGQFAVAAGETVVRLWNTQTGQEVRRFEGHAQVVNAVAFSADGKRLLTGSMDNTVRLWDVATGRPLYRFEGHQGAVQSVAFSPRGGRAVSGSSDQTVRIWGLPR